MNNILLVFTGGTIGSQINHDTISPGLASNSQLLSLYQQHSDSLLVNFKTIQALQVLSENLHPDHWTAIIKAIDKENLANFDGIIITHGTDTLAFSAAVLALYYNNIPIPIILVSSDFPLALSKANGLANFVAAVEFIKQVKKAGVFVAYKNPGQCLHIYHAARLSSCLALSSDFIGIQNRAYMHFQDLKFTELDVVATIQQTPVKLIANFSARILLIRPYPGLNYKHFNLDNIDVVLHDLYHSGTACVSDSYGCDFSLIEFIKHCRQQQISIYLSPILKSEIAYSSTRELIASGAEIIWNMSLEASYAKLLLAYGNFSDKGMISNFLEQDIAFEHLSN